MNARFDTGQLIATPAALEALEEAEQTPFELLERHLQGDWGDVCQEDKIANDRALVYDSRLLSVYTLRSGERLWIITEHDRSVTTLLLPDDY